MKMNPWIIWRHVSNIRNEHSKWKVDTVFMFDLIHQKWSRSVSRELMGHIIWQICNTETSTDKEIKWDISVFLSNVLWSLFVPIHFGASVTKAAYYKRIWDLQIFSPPQDFFFWLSTESFILFLIFKDSEGAKFSYLSGIDDPLAPCFSDVFENPTSFPWLSVYWREHKIYLSGVSNMKNVHTLLKDDGDVNMIKGKHGVRFGNKAVII